MATETTALIKHALACGSGFVLTNPNCGDPPVCGPRVNREEGASGGAPKTVVIPDLHRVATALPLGRGMLRRPVGRSAPEANSRFAVFHKRKAFYRHNSKDLSAVFFWGVPIGVEAPRSLLFAFFLESFDLSVTFHESTRRAE